LVAALIYTHSYIVRYRNKLGVLEVKL